MYFFNLKKIYYLYINEYNINKGIKMGCKY